MMRLLGLIFLMGMTKVLLAQGKLHTIIIQDYTDARFAEAFKQDSISLNTLFDRMEEATGKKRNKLFLTTSENFQRKIILDKINNLKVATDDVLIYYYNGHCNQINRKEDRQRKQRIRDETISIGEIEDLIRQKSAKLSITFTDCCGSNAKKKGGNKTNLALGKSINDNIKTMYSKLLNCSGDYTVYSCTGGESAYVFEKYGSIFTQNLVEVFRYFENRPQQASWQNILQETKMRTIEKAELEFEYQTPKWHPKFCKN